MSVRPIRPDDVPAVVGLVREPADYEKALGVRPSVSAVIFDRRGRLLLQQRSDGGQWGLPGGSVEIGESVADAVVREVLEETGLTVRPRRIVGVYSDPALQVVRYPDGNVWHYVNVCFECTAHGGTLTTCDETLALGVDRPVVAQHRRQYHAGSVAMRHVAGAAEHVADRMARAHRHAALEAQGRQPGAELAIEPGFEIGRVALDPEQGVGEEVQGLLRAGLAERVGRPPTQPFDGVVDSYGEAAVVGAPHDDLGQQVVAYVVADGVGERELIDFVARSLSVHKRPRVVRFLEELPRNAMGKPQKKLLPPL